MKNEIKSNHNNRLVIIEQQKKPSETLPQILFITSYTPRECGITTYSQDLIKALNNKFNHSFNLKICPIESENERHTYTNEAKYILNIDSPKSFVRLAENINEDPKIKIVMIQHEFELFQEKDSDFVQFLNIILKPVCLVLHTVLPNPDIKLKSKVRQIFEVCESIIVMTHASEEILIKDYGLGKEKITVIQHGTHLVSHSNKDILKEKYQLRGRTILSTFGLLSAEKCIETTLKALPEIVEKNPEVLFLIIGKTHPSVVKHEGENTVECFKIKLKRCKFRIM